jgi:hypothetical protein
MSSPRRTRVVSSKVECDGRAREAAVSHRRNRSRPRHALLACESLESRVVLTNSAVGTSLLGTLSYVGVVTSPVTTATVPILPILPVVPLPLAAVPFASTSAGSTWKQLGTDLQKLQLELESLAQKSGVTIADLENLTNDSAAIASTGFHFGVKSLNSVINELATAVAGGTSTSQAQTDFTALFSKSSVSATTITTTFNDLVQTIHDSAVTTTDLSTVAADEAAIQGDLPRIPTPWLPQPEPWIDQVGATPDAVTVANPVASLPAPVTTLPNIVVTPGYPVPTPPIIVQPPIIISPFGNSSLPGALSSVGVVTSPVVVVPSSPIPTPVAATATGGHSQLQIDLQALRTELESLAAKSGLTIADLESLSVDSQTITQAGFRFDPQSLNSAISELAKAVAGGTSTSQAQTDFTALFNGSSVSTTTINTTFSNLTKAIQDSGVLPADLTTVAADRAAIQADLKNLYPGNGGGTGGGSGGSTGSGGSSGGTSTGGTTGTGTTGSSGGTTGTGTTGSSGGTTGTGTTGSSGGTTGTGTTGSSGGHKSHVGKHKLARPQHIKVAAHEHSRTLDRLKKK